MNHITRCIELVGLAELARRNGVTYQALRKWERNRIPADRCAGFIDSVNRDYPGAVTEHQLRPDLWGPDGCLPTGSSEIDDQEAA